MFWVDAELGVDIYLDGKLKQIFFCFQVKCYGLDFFFIHIIILIFALLLFLNLFSLIMK